MLLADAVVVVALYYAPAIAFGWPETQNAGGMIWRVAAAISVLGAWVWLRQRFLEQRLPSVEVLLWAIHGMASLTPFLCLIYVDRIANMGFEGIGWMILACLAMLFVQLMVAIAALIRRYTGDREPLQGYDRFATIFCLAYVVAAGVVIALEP
ncbi:MAG: hypothetical protein KDE45_19095 [Caldilineaceae bacterium]|nr:hypothetical protein [Caldilineaceae bacterium]